MTVRAIVLAGGAGSRLWPLSTPARPKPLVDLLGEGPMVRATLARVAALASARPVVVGAQAIAGALVAALQGDADVLAEPAPRGTAAAVTAAALRVDPAEVLLVLPADHHVVDRPAFHAALTVAIRHAEAGRLVLLGVRPTRPEPGFGHVRVGAPFDGAHAVDAFVEKPDAARAAAWAADGQHVWNAGIFLFRADAWLAEIRTHAPAILDACRRAVDGATAGPAGTLLGRAFADAPAAAIDTAVMERTRRAVVVPLHAGWSDVGTFRALWAARPQDADGNVVVGPATLQGCRDCLVWTDRPVRLAGLTGRVWIDVHGTARGVDLSGS